MKSTMLIEDVAENFRISDSFRTFSKISGFLVIITGLAALSGWVFNIQFLKSISPNWVSMPPTAAVNFLFAGLSILMLQQSGNSTKRKIIIGKICAAFIGSVGLVIVSEYVFNWNSGINTFFFKESIASEKIISPKGLPPMGALNFFLLGLSLLLLDGEIKKRNYFFQFPALIVLFLAFLQLIDYMFWDEKIYESLGYIHKMPFMGAVNFLFFSLGILLSRPRLGFMSLLSSDSVGGKLFRNQFPVTILVLILLFELRYIGQQSGYFSYEVAIALMLTSTVIVLSFIMWKNSRSLTAEDIQRKKAEKKCASWRPLLNPRMTLFLRGLRMKQYYPGTGEPKRSLVIAQKKLPAGTFLSLPVTEKKRKFINSGKKFSTVKMSKTLKQ